MSTDTPAQIPAGMKSKVYRYQLKGRTFKNIHIELELSDKGVPRISLHSADVYGPNGYERTIEGPWYITLSLGNLRWSEKP